MRPTSTTNNSKTSGKSQILKTPFVSTPFRESKFNSTIWRNFCGSSFRFLTHSRYNFKRDCERRVKFGFEILVLERKICYREGKWNWLIVISTMATDGAAEFMSNYGRSVLIPIYEISRNYEKRKGGGRRIFLSETEIRIYETQVTKSRNLTRYW